VGGPASKRPGAQKSTAVLRSRAEAGRAQAEASPAGEAGGISLGSPAGEAGGGEQKPCGMRGERAKRGRTGFWKV
jgi:hypothetical protein